MSNDRYSAGALAQRLLGLMSCAGPEQRFILYLIFFSFGVVAKGGWRLGWLRAGECLWFSPRQGGRGLSEGIQFARAMQECFACLKPPLPLPRGLNGKAGEDDRAEGGEDRWQGAADPREVGGKEGGSAGTESCFTTIVHVS